jgi:hypothetical protein
MLKASYDRRTARVTGVYGLNVNAPKPFVFIDKKEYEEKKDCQLFIGAGKLIAIPDNSKILAEYDKAMEEHIYSIRAARGYTTREPGVYINSTVARWKADAEVWNAWLDAVMQYSLNILNTAKKQARYRRWMNT